MKKNKDPDKVFTLRGCCEENGYGGVTQECIISAFNSDNPKIQEMAKREKFKSMLDNSKE